MVITKPSPDPSLRGRGVGYDRRAGATPGRLAGGNTASGHRPHVLQRDLRLRIPSKDGLRVG